MQKPLRNFDAIDTGLRPREAGIPVRACYGRLNAGTDAGGNPCLYLAMSQHSPAAGMFVLRIDPDTGAIRRYDGPAIFSGTRTHYWSERWNSLFCCATGDISGVLLRLDPKTDALEEVGPPESIKNFNPVSIDEASDGSIYIGNYGTCTLTRYHPGTGEWTDLGRMSQDDMYFYVQCGADGTVAGLVKMAHPHVVALDVKTGRHVAVGPRQERTTDEGHVALHKRADGMLYIESHAGWFRVSGMEAIPIPDPAAIPPPLKPKPLADGKTFRLLGHTTEPRNVEVVSPDGTRRVHHLDWEGAGTELYIVRSCPNAMLYGSSVLPLHLFSHDPATGQSVDFGQSTTSTGEVYSLDMMDGLLYYASYTHAVLSVFDPSKPFCWGRPDPDNPGAVLPLKALSDWPCHVGHGADDNPKQLGRMDSIAYRPRDMCAGPGGKVWVASVPDYGMWGGTLSWYDPKTNRFGGAHRNIYQDCSPYVLTYIEALDRLLVGFSIYAGSGTEPKAVRTGFAAWDPVADRETWRGDFGLNLVGVMDVEYAGGTLAYAIVHPNPADVLYAKLVLLDVEAGTLISEADLTAVMGWPLEVTFQRDTEYLYGATREGVYRVRLGTTTIEPLWRDADDGPRAGGALCNGEYFFCSGHRLRAIRPSGTLSRST